MTTCVRGLGRPAILTTALLCVITIRVLAQSGDSAPVRSGSYTPDLNDAAKVPFQKGVIAAQQQDWKLAIHYFQEAQTAAPDAPQIWFNLGLASAKLPGYELRALAWFQAYLLAVPNAPNAEGIRQQIATLESSFKSRLGGVIDAFEAIPPAILTQARNFDSSDPKARLRGRHDLDRKAADIGVSLAAARAFMGDSAGALKTFKATTGADWDEAKLEDGDCRVRGFGPAIQANRMVDALVAGDRSPSTILITRCGLVPSTAFHIMEAGDFDFARRILAYHAAEPTSELSEYPKYYETMACYALDLKKPEAFEIALADVETVRDRIPDFDYNGHRVYLSELEIAAHRYGDARSYVLGMHMGKKDSIPLPEHLLGVLVAVGEKERATAIAKRFGLGDTLEAYTSGSVQLPDPCLDISGWWGRSRELYLVNLARGPIEFPKRSGDMTSGFMNETELPDFLRLNQDVLGGPDPVAAANVAKWIAEILLDLAQEYRTVHGPHVR